MLLLLLLDLAQGPDEWPNTALPMKQRAEADKVEAEEGDQDEVRLHPKP